MKWLWTWGGICFGYLEEDNLWTHDGFHVGQLRNDEVFGMDGQYLGEIKNDDRLITNISKKGRSSFGFSPFMNRVGYVKYVDYVGYVMYVGYEDFQSPERIKARYHL